MTQPSVFRYQCFLLGAAGGYKVPTCQGRSVTARARRLLVALASATMLLRLSALTSLLAALPASSVFGGQIPIVNGVLGGTETVASSKFKVADLAPAATTPGKLRVVENSGVCETTPGVYQASGYGDLTSNESIWSVLLQTGGDRCQILTEPRLRFWFFAARKNSDTAPLSIWLNGGVSGPALGLVLNNR